MIEAGGGSIIYITSILAMRGGGPAPYAASKAGLMGLTTSLANTFGVNGIRVNCVAPGNVDTPMRSGLLARAGFDLTQVDATKATSLGIQGDAWDIADAALYLASDAGRYITGLLLPVDGGTTTKLP
jgi:NAD(P)-dependent dehydrogenase (short-subunit alcohol dehydrogenase family)